MKRIIKKTVVGCYLLLGVTLFAQAAGNVINPTIALSDSTGQRSATVAANSGVSLQQVTTLIQDGILNTAYEPSWSLLVGDPNQTTLPRKITFRNRAVSRYELVWVPPPPGYNSSYGYYSYEWNTRPAVVLASFRIEANGTVKSIPLPAPYTSYDVPSLGQYCSVSATPVGPAIGSKAMVGDANSAHGAGWKICSFSPIISTKGALIGWSMGWFRDYGTYVSASWSIPNGATGVPFAGPVVKDADACNWTIGGSAGRSCWVAPDIFPEVIFEQ